MTTTATPARSPRTPRRPPLDAACAEAVELARSAAAEASDTELGEHEEVVAEADRVATHYFACTHRGYRGWRWAVTVARASRARTVTVDEVVLLPGPTALQSPVWLPWAERVQAGDLGPGVLMPTDDDEAALVPTYAGFDPAAAGPLAPWAAEPELLAELGYGRARVLSPEGRLEAAERWASGGGGPEAPIARAAPARCVSCGWLAPLAGALGQALGVCSNRLAPDDGRVVTLDHGCGGHSESSDVPPAAAVPDPVLDELDDAPLELGPRETETADEAPDDEGAAAGSADVPETELTTATDVAPEQEPMEDETPPNVAAEITLVEDQDDQEVSPVDAAGPTAAGTAEPEAADAEPLPADATEPEDS